jgi:exosortase
MTRPHTFLETAWRRRATVATTAAIVGGVAWAYAPTLATLVRRWEEEPQYSHGFVVPILALVVWLVRRSRFPVTSSQPSWWGLAFLAFGAALRLAGAYFSFDWLDAVSLLPVFLGFSLLAGGWQLCRQVAPAVALLLFLIPFPFQVEGLLSAPLQRLATLTSTYMLQTFGLPAVSEGNVIHIDDMKIGVVEACSGLGMLSAFFALSTTAALVLRRPLRDRVVVFLSAIPIGVFMNLLRITATGLVYGASGSQTAQAFFHALAGWLMMPGALAALALELYLLRRLFLDSADNEPSLLKHCP